ncbi:MAG: roadblock/LC7 domain-containing protein [Promethearchaeota archaeon]
MSNEIEIDPQVQLSLSAMLEEIESKTELEACAIISQTGLRVAHADSTVGPTIDADLYSASPATLLALGSTVTMTLEYGEVTEVVVRGTKGYTIITASKEIPFILLSTAKKAYKLGYFFHVLRKTFSRATELLKDVQIGSAVY